MYSAVSVPVRRLEDYASIVSSQAYEELAPLAVPLRGARVLHLSTLAFGTAATEFLNALVPLQRSLGLQAEWRVIAASEEFRTLCQQLYQALTGLYVPWTPALQACWQRYLAQCAAQFAQEPPYDFVVVHDPQPLGILGHLKQPRGRWIWHSHQDLREAQPEVWDVLRTMVAPYTAAVFAAEDYWPPELPIAQRFVIPPAIDPLSGRNVALPPDVITEVLRRYGIDPARPLLCQIAPVDPWNDPLRLIDAYRIVKAEQPEVQLVLVATMGAAGADTHAYYERVARHAAGDPDIHLLSTLNNVGHTEQNAFQRAAAVVCQTGVRRGFSIALLDAAWKRRPVVAGRVWGLPLQVIDGETGLLADSAEEFGTAVLRLLRLPEEAERLGANGQRYVEERFLVLRGLRDYCQLFAALR
jgi:trehalose synthase